MPDKQAIGVYLDERTVDRADELKRERDRLGRAGASRSAVLADASEIGLPALELFEEHMPHAGTREQRDALRTALKEHFGEIDR